METIIKDAFNPEQFTPFVPEAVLVQRENLNRILIGIAAVVVLMIVISVIQARMEEKKRDEGIRFM